MNIDLVYQPIQFIVNKAQTGNATPGRVNIAMRMANSSLWKRYNGIPEEWQPGMPLSKMAFSIGTNIEKVMEKFKVPVTLYINDQGVAQKPADFIRESELTYKYIDANGVTKYSQVDICNDNEFQERKTSYIVPASKDNPACRFMSTTIEFLPNDLINVDMTYLRMAITPVWGYTLVNGRPVYDPSTSVNPEWPDDIINDFIMLTCQYLGINMNKDVLYQEMQAYKMQGQ